MMKRTRFPHPARCQLSTLLQRLDYLPNGEHDNHYGKIVQPLQLFGCGGDTVEAYLATLEELAERYHESRKGKKGYHTQKRWDEWIYSAPEGSFLTQAERELLWQEFTGKLFADVPVAGTWHVDELLGRADLHFLVGAHTDAEIPRVWSSDRFGHGKLHILLEAERVEAAALALINRNRDQEHQILTARETRRRKMLAAKGKTLAEQLAKVWNGRRETLKAALKKIRYRCVKMSAKTVRVVGVNWRKTRSFVIATLQKEVARIQAKDKPLDGPAI